MHYYSDFMPTINSIHKLYNLLITSANAFFVLFFKRENMDYLHISQESELILDLLVVIL